jgi:dCMP deaminase
MLKLNVEVVKVPELIGSERRDWHRFFMDIAKEVGKQSNCPLKHVGAVIVDDETRRILAMGYNGVPKGIEHKCLKEKKCPRLEQNSHDYSVCPAVHAEINAVIQCAYYGVSTKGKTLYCEYMPCHNCTAVLINAGIKKIIYEKPPVDTYAQPLALDAGVRLFKLVNWNLVEITKYNLDKVETW